MRRIAIAVLVLALAAGFYLLLIDTTSLPELYAGCVIVLLAMAAFELSRRQGVTEAAAAPQWLLRTWRPLVRVPLSIALVCWEALAQLTGRRRAAEAFRAIPFKGGAGPRDHGRRALTEVLGSLAPNTIVIGIDPDRELLLVHQLRHHGGREELDVMGLG